MDGSAIASLRVTTTTVGVDRRFVFASVFYRKVKQKETERNNRIVRRGSILRKKLVVKKESFFVLDKRERRGKKKIVSPFSYLS